MLQGLLAVAGWTSGALTTLANHCGMQGSLQASVTGMQQLLGFFRMLGSGFGDTPACVSAQVRRSLFGLGCGDSCYCCTPMAVLPPRLCTQTRPSSVAGMCLGAALCVCSTHPCGELVLRLSASERWGPDSLWAVA